MDALTPLERGLIAHLIADWLLQNEWIATGKVNLRHPAAWVHAGAQALALTLALGWPAGLVLGIAHLLIDTRLPLHWWQRLIRQRQEGQMGLHISIWADQVLHVVCIAAWVVVAGPR